MTGLDRDITWGNIQDLHGVTEEKSSHNSSGLNPEPSNKRLVM